LWKEALKEWNMLRPQQVDEWQAEAEKRGKDAGRKEGLDIGFVLGAYRMLCKKGASAEQARQEVIAEFGPEAAAILDQTNTTPRTTPKGPNEKQHPYY
jgi:hypothetical protein